MNETINKTTHRVHYPIFPIVMLVIYSVIIGIILCLVSIDIFGLTIANIFSILAWIVIPTGLSWILFLIVSIFRERVKN